MATYFISQRMEDGSIKHLEHYFTFEDAKKAMMIYQNALFETGRYQIADSLFIEKKEEN